MSANVRIDTGGFTAFAARLRELVASFPVEEEKFLGVCAEGVATKAKSNASESTSTQPTIRVISRPVKDGQQSIAVGAGYSGSGNPGLYPLLREGWKGKLHWEHPVFGNPGVLVAQLSQPYLKPALEDSGTAIETIASEAIEEQLEMELSGTFSG